jgi:hypothetical protein
MLRPEIAAKIRGRKRPPRSPEWAAAIARGKTGKPNGHKGRKHTEEAKQKMSLAKAGKSRPPRGPMPEETKAKIAATLRRRSVGVR